MEPVTHMAVIQHLDDRVTYVASGSESHVRTRLAHWERTHAASAFDTPLILQIIDPAPEG